MKKSAISLFILLAYFISGGDVCAVNSNNKEGTQQATTAQEQITAETKQQPVSHQSVQSVVKEQAAEVNPKNNLKPSQSGVEGKYDQTEQAEAKQRLDLSVPDKIQETTIFGHSPPKKKRGHLPVLFTNKNNKNNKKLQVDGKFIAREEEEIGKTRAVDGVGIDFKLTP